jgi:hypothetical protein
VSVSRGASTAFVGRTELLAEVRSAAADLARRTGRLIAIDGEAGSGKSRLLAEIDHVLSSLGLASCSIRLFDSEQYPSFYLWQMVFRCVGDHRGAGPRDALSSAHSVAQAVDELCLDGPVVALFDNIEWADSDSIMALRHICSLMHRSPVLAAITYRTDQVAHRAILAEAIADFSSSPACSAITLGPLTPDECRAIVLCSGADLSEAEICRICERSEGNPFLLSELLHGPRTWTGPEADTPPAISARLDAQLERAGAEAARCLEYAAVIGERFDLVVLSDLLDRTLSETEDLVCHPALTGLVRPHGGEALQYEFCHGAFRDHLSKRIGQVRAMELHRRIAEQLALNPDGKGHARRYLFHLSHACPLVDSDAVAEEARGLVEREQSRNHAGAVVDCAEMVISVLRSDRNRARPDATLAEFLHIKAVALGELWAVEAQKQALTEAFRIYDRLGRLDRLVKVAITWIPMPAGHGSPVIHRMVTPDPDLVAAAQTRVQPGSLEEAWLLSYSDSVDADRLAAIHDTARRENDAALEMQVIAHRIMRCHGSGHWEESRDLETGLLEMSLRADNFDALYEGAYWSVARDVSGGDIRSTQKLRYRALAWTRPGRRVLNAIDTFPLVEAVTGYWDKALEKSDRIIRSSGAKCNSFPVSFAYLTLGCIHAEQGNDEAFESVVREFTPLCQTRDVRLAALLAIAAVIRGDDDAMSRATGILDELTLEDGAPYWYRQFAHCVAVESAVFRVDADAARNLLSDGRFDLVSYRVPAIQFWNPYLHKANLLSVCGERDAATAEYERAIGFCSKAGYRPALATACRDYAQFLAGSGPDSRRLNDVADIGLTAARACGMVRRAADLERLRGGAPTANNATQTGRSRKRWSSACTRSTGTFRTCSARPA